LKIRAPYYLHHRLSITFIAMPSQMTHRGSNIVCLLPFLLLVLVPPLSARQSATSLSEADSVRLYTVIFAAKEVQHDYPDSCLQLAGEALAISQSLGYDKGVADAYNLYGVAYDIKGLFARSFDYTKQAMDIYKRIGERLGAANCQSNMAIILKQDGKYDEALEYLTESYEYYKEAGYRAHEANSLGSIANIMLAQGAPLAEIVSRQDEALEILRSIDNKPSVCSMLNLEGDAYYKYDQLDTAVARYKSSIVLATELNRPFNLGYSYLGLAKTYLKKRDFDQAMASARKGLVMYEKIRHRFGIMDLYAVMVDISSQRGDYKSGFDYQQKFQAFKDSLYNDQQSKQIRILKEEYDSEKKEAEIQNLNQQAALQALVISQRNTQFGVVVVGLLLLIVAGVAISQRRSFKQKQAADAVEQRFLRSQLNPHFIFNSMAAIQQYLMVNEPEEASHFLGTFGKLMRQILENSRQEFITLEEEVNMLSNYLELQKMRFRGQFEYTIDIDEKLNEEEVEVPPMFAQPFIENSLEHGLFRKEGGVNQIVVRFAYLSNDLIRLEVSDNGVGVQKAQPSGDHQSLATTITRERLAAMRVSMKKEVGMKSENIMNQAGTVDGYKTELILPVRLVWG